MLPITLYLAGLALRGREALARRLAAQSDELEVERDAYARLLVRYERARAAELHDVVAHAISVMVVQATAGQRLAVREPARAAETFDVIATAARQAQADLDRLADLLTRDAAPDESADLASFAKSSARRRPRGYRSRSEFPATSQESRAPSPMPRCGLCRKG